ncbi:MAG: ComEA protein [Candidatus Woesebacteria bacterium GW2011_GWB1_44_11b]|uniref:ComEA protein n=2 Tax=Candidatus Woeseibacteriota TaxID=1752722 RepID=A0A0G1IR45_9BACT|nr:MAG: ComEA protein [Candidatus Woesebacteria bacterium GW2011_GWB1_44_11b]
MEILYKFRFQILFVLLGLLLVGVGLFSSKKAGWLDSSSKVEVLESSTEGQDGIGGVVVEVAGAVENPGVYQLSEGARIEDALIAAGGISADADREWMEKILNRAAKITDGQKIYIKHLEEESANILGVSSGSGGGLPANSEGVININTASQKELESLPGIGPVTAQNIIEHRPYSSVEELLQKKILKTNVYETNKDRLSVY